MPLLHKKLAYFLESFPEPAIAPSTFYILKPGEGVVPGYLCWCINQVQVQVQVRELRTGAGAPMIPRQGFMDIIPPLPSLKTQGKVAGLAVLLSKETVLRERLKEEMKRLHSEIGNQILKNLMGSGQKKDIK